MGWFASILENLAFSVTEKMDTARLLELMADCPIIIQCNYQRLKDEVNMELQLDATITVLLISKISSTCFGQTFAHLQERKT
jgi:hypothetical protein